MTLTLQLPSTKTRKLNERAKNFGITAEEFAEKVLEFIADASDEDFESWIETLEILLDREFVQELEASIKQVQEGKVTEWDQAKRELGLA
ncbi:MAG: hypothetical protein ACE5IR_10490 [bacterium]